jgi:hypothetical protein
VIHDALEWLGATPWSVALVESYYMWPLLESAHTLLIALFVGTAIMLDLRLMGVTFGGIPTSQFTERLLPWTRAGFALMVLTGLLLFYSAPVRYWYNIFFRFKVLLIVGAGLNIFLFHRGIYTRMRNWDHDPIPPRTARAAGLVSIVAWSMIVVSGRMIAYNWFDCDIQPQPGWVNTLAGCAVDGQ